VKKKHSNPILSFLWRPAEISQDVTAVADRTSTDAIFDIGSGLSENVLAALQSAEVTNIKVSIEDLMDTELERLLGQTRIETIWVETIPALGSCKPDDFLRRLHQLTEGYECIPISGDLEFLNTILRAEWAPPSIAIKGSEAAGFVSKETTAIIFANLRKLAKQRVPRTDLIIWGGIATPEAAAAFLCSGARKIVFESLHWQTDLATANQDLKDRLSRLRPEHTTVVGQGLGVVCRFFDKGNSLAVKDLRQFADSLYRCEPDKQDYHNFCLHVKKKGIPVHRSELGRHELIFMGPEAAFAETFAERFGRSTDRAIEAFSNEVMNCCSKAPEKLHRVKGNAAASALGTTYPFFQGAMTWISDRPDFALAVADAGGLPAISLGLKSLPDLEQDLGNLKEFMGERVYAINFLALPENPHLEKQLTWIERLRPPMAVIAAGEPSYAVRLQEKGIQAIYIASSVDLLRIAFAAGIRFVVLEGNEAGGHVGEHSTLTMAQIALALRRKEPELFRDRYLVLAGGFYDRETAFRAFMLGADGIQMGTAYVATHEIVGTGALNPLFQRVIVESRPGMTTVSGESIGLRVRSLKSPKMDAICNLEKKWAAGGLDEGTFRNRLEALAANSLLIAARSAREPHGDKIDDETCLNEGQFMCGAVSGMVNQVRSIEALHHELAEGPMELTIPEKDDRPVPAATIQKRSHTNGDRVAITGMAVVNALGNSPHDIWQASLAMRSGIVEVPRSRWDHDLYYDPDPRARGRTYCNVGAFQNIDISRKQLVIAPQDFRSMADSTKLTLWLAENAIQQSGLLDSGIPRERIGVLISQNSGEAAGTITDLVFDVYSHDVIRTMQDVIPMTPELETMVRDKIKAGRLSVDDTTLLGRLNCAAGGFVCNKYGFQGPSFSVSAACATSLVALYNAIQMIRNGIIDAAVVGGGEETLKPSHYLEFSALKALAMLSGAETPARERSRPFDATRDGMVLGEGGGMIVVERESIAKKRNAPIHAYITGMGASNNDQGMVESLAETQLIALKASYRDTHHGPDQVDLVECHATSTIQGDIEEVKALKTLFGTSNGVKLASFKAQIGHTLGASGLNSLIRGVTAMQAGIFPPTPNYRNRDPRIDLEAAGFHVPDQPDDWPQPADRPRRMQVNAFGFGGANYVVQLEQCRSNGSPVMTELISAEEPDRDRGPARHVQTPVEGVSFFEAHLADQSYRLGIVAPDASESRAKLQMLNPFETGTALSEKTLRVMARQGVFAAPTDTQTDPMAFVFAGQGSQYIGMGKELYHTFPEIRRWMDRIAAVADFDLLDLLFNSAEEDLQKTRWQQPALYTMEYAMVQYLISLGVRPTAMAGHSLGELVALSIAGVFSFDDGFRIVNKRAQCMDKAGGLEGDPGTMIAVDAPMDYLKEKVAGCQNVYFTNYNAPHQVVIGGHTGTVLDLMADIQQDSHRATRLKVSMAFHSPIMKVIRAEMAAFVSAITFHSPKVPVISNTTMAPYPDDPNRIRAILMAHLESPVHWMQNVRTLWDQFGIRHFIEIGPKDTLCNLVGETLDKALCFPTCMSETEATTYRTSMARLYTLGHLKPGQVLRLDVPAPSKVTATAPLSAHRAPAENRVAAIVQREINDFILESFGKIIKPKIVDAVRRELDPGFTAEHLDQILEDSPAPQPKKTPRSKIPPAPVTAEPNYASPPPADSISLEDSNPEVDTLEQVIQIIMDATGYDRDEIEPDMDIRQDLAIRSSCLPVIMDDVERQFEIKVSVEDFVGLRTVQEIADTIAKLAGRTGGISTTEKPAEKKPANVSRVAADGAGGADTTVRQETSIRRLVFKEAQLPSAPQTPFALEPGQDVAILKMGTGSLLAADFADILKARFEARPIELDCLGLNKNDRFDLRTPEGADRAAEELEKARSLAGLVLVLEAGSESALSGTRDIPAFLSGFFVCLQKLLGSQSKAFCLCLTRGIPSHTPEAHAAEGILGMFLATAQEYSSVRFRSVDIDAHTDSQHALDRALDAGNPLIQVIARNGATFSLKAFNEPLPLKGRPELRLGPGAVVVISGGAKGVSYRIARALAPFRPRIVLLGRTELDPGAAYGVLRHNGDPATKDIPRLAGMNGTSEMDENKNRHASKNLAGLDIARNVARLSALGLKVTYHRCDVADTRDVTRALAEVVKQYGRVDGIIHGAGIIEDAFIEFMKPEDVKNVVDVKLLGARNLYHASKDHGLRFMAALSSLVAIQGNVGQANYCAANRSLSALMKSLADSHEGLVAKAFMLPPIEGTGMAENPEVKELMKLKGLESTFVHADEFAQLFCRELFLGPARDCWIAWARTFPTVIGTLVEASNSDDQKVKHSPGGVSFRPEDFPLITTVDALELEKGELSATRKFSPDADLWLSDHKPFKILKHPLVSGIMAVETFLEAARLLYPHLSV